MVSFHFSSIKEGSLCWIPNTEKGWILGYVLNHEELDGEESFSNIQHLDDEKYFQFIQFLSSSSTQSSSILNDDTSFNKSYLTSPYYPSTSLPTEKILTSSLVRFDSSHFNDVNDLCELNYLHEAPLLFTLKKRFFQDKIYTNAGDVLISINPYKKIEGLYENYGDYLEYNPNNSSSSSSEEKKDSIPPHVYKIAKLAILNLMKEEKEREAGLDDDADEEERRRKTCLNQSIIVSGESGAGKTEATKYLMNFLMKFDEKKALTSTHISLQTQQKLCQKINQVLNNSNVILESFGNAKTLRNFNSSRFGKYIKLQYDDKDHLVSAYTETFLLEKSRLLRTSEGESNYHIFYQLLSSLDSLTGESGSLDKEFVELKKELNLNSIKDFKMLNSSGAATDEHLEIPIQFQELHEALLIIGCSKEELVQLYTLLACLLHMSNLDVEILYYDDERIDKKEAEGESAEGDDLPVCEEEPAHAKILSSSLPLGKLTSLLGIDQDIFSNRLTTQRVKVGTRSSITIKKLYEHDIKNNIGALIKWIYSCIFSWLLKKINYIHCSVYNLITEEEEKDSGRGRTYPVKFIGILDIFGFEILKKNSFEQLCINYTNEKLQKLFNENFFTYEENFYLREGLDWNLIQFFNNDEIIDCIGKKNSGLLSILDQQVMLNRGQNQREASSDNTSSTTEREMNKDEEFLLKNFNSVQESLSPNVYKKSKIYNGNFVIKHFAGEVTYNVVHFIDKNNDSLQEDLMELMMCSSNVFIQNSIVSVGLENQPGIPGEVGYIENIDSNLIVPSQSPLLSGAASAAASAAASSSSVNKKKSRRTSLISTDGVTKKLASTITVSSQFSSQLNLLIENLNLTSLLYVKCLKSLNFSSLSPPSSPSSSPSEVSSHPLSTFDHNLLLNQLKFNGILEIVRIRQDGYSIHKSFSHFLAFFSLLFFLKENEKVAISPSSNSLTTIVTPTLTTATSVSIAKSAKFIEEIIKKNKNINFSSASIPSLNSEEEILQNKSFLHDIFLLHDQYSSSPDELRINLQNYFTKNFNEDQMKKLCIIICEKFFSTDILSLNNYYQIGHSKIFLNLNFYNLLLRNIYQYHYIRKVKFSSNILQKNVRKYLSIQRILKKKKLEEIERLERERREEEERKKREEEERKKKELEEKEEGEIIRKNKEDREKKENEEQSTTTRSSLNRVSIVKKIDPIFEERIDKLHTACFLGDLETVKKGLRENPLDYNVRNNRYFDCTLVQSAILGGSLKLFQYLSPSLEDLETVDSRGYNSIHYIALSLSRGVVEILNYIILFYSSSYSILKYLSNTNLASLTPPSGPSSSSTGSSSTASVSYTTLLDNITSILTNSSSSSSVPISTLNYLTTIKNNLYLVNFLNRELEVERRPGATYPIAISNLFQDPSSPHVPSLTSILFSRESIYDRNSTIVSAPSSASTNSSAPRSRFFSSMFSSNSSSTSALNKKLSNDDDSGDERFFSGGRDDGDDDDDDDEFDIPETELKTGWLQKRGDNQLWRRRYFVLTNENLKYFHSNKDKVASDCINFSKFKNKILIERTNDSSYSFDIIFLNDDSATTSQKKKRERITLMADSEVEIQSWIDLLYGATSSPYKSLYEYSNADLSLIYSNFNETHQFFSSRDSNLNTLLHLLCSVQLPLDRHLRDCFSSTTSPSELYKEVLTHADRLEMIFSLITAGFPHELLNNENKSAKDIALENNLLDVFLLINRLEYLAHSIYSNYDIKFNTNEDSTLTSSSSSYSAFWSSNLFLNSTNSSSNFLSNTILKTKLIKNLLKFSLSRDSDSSEAVDIENYLLNTSILDIFRDKNFLKLSLEEKKKLVENSSNLSNIRENFYSLPSRFFNLNYLTINVIKLKILNSSSYFTIQNNNSSNSSNSSLSSIKTSPFYESQKANSSDFSNQLSSTLIASSPSPFSTSVNPSSYFDNFFLNDLHTNDETTNFSLNITVYNKNRKNLIYKKRCYKNFIPCHKGSEFLFLFSYPFYTSLESLKENEIEIDIELVKRDIFIIASGKYIFICSLLCHFKLLLFFFSSF